MKIQSPSVSNRVKTEKQYLEVIFYTATSPTSPRYATTVLSSTHDTAQPRYKRQEVK